MYCVVESGGVTANPSGIAAIAVERIDVATGDVLFQPGDARRHYRVEEGAIFHYIRWSDGSHDLIEVAFPGEIIGLGHLDRHVSTAQAMVDSVVSHVSDEEIADLLNVEDRLPLLLASAGEREFDYMRDTTINSGRRTPVERLANYLLAIANDSLIADDVSSGFVADRLQMSVDTLSSALVGLERKGLVALSESGLKITDVVELERVANAA
jgi:CRP/FNR family transcriptional regulator